MTCTSRIVAASLGACVGVIAGAVAGVVLGVVALEQLRRMGR